LAAGYFEAMVEIEVNGIAPLFKGRLLTEGSIVIDVQGQI
jgi:hypothetical protein